MIACCALVVPAGALSLETADVVLRLHLPNPEHVARLRRDAVHLSLLDPFHRPDLLRQLAAGRVSAVAFELVPRVARAQSMDVLSSQASLAGYVAVLLAAERLNRVLPMMTTAAGRSSSRMMPARTASSMS